jgi:hypothetical protein
MFGVRSSTVFAARFSLGSFLAQFFLERSRLNYRRFQFHMYVQHKLALGFVLISNGRRDEGLERIREFCSNTGATVDDQVFSACIRQVELHAVQ